MSQRGVLPVRGPSLLLLEVYVAATRSITEGRNETVTDRGYPPPPPPHRPLAATTVRRDTLDATLRRERPTTGPTHLDRATSSARLQVWRPTRRMALTLRYLDDMSVAEVAEASRSPTAQQNRSSRRARRSFETAWEAAP